MPVFHPEMLQNRINWENILINGNILPELDSERNATGTSLFAGLLHRISDCIVVVLDKRSGIWKAGAGKQGDFVENQGFQALLKSDIRHPES